MAGEHLANAAQSQQYRFKGTYVVQIRRWLCHELGNDAWSKYFATRGDEWTYQILPHGWYDAQVVNDALRVIASDVRLDFAETVAGLAAQTSREDLPTVYRVFFRVMSPNSVFRFMPQLWRAYCTHGEMKVVHNEIGRCVVDTRGIPDWLVEFTRGSVCGFMKQVVTLAGGARPHARIVDESIEQLGKWQGLNTLRGEIHYEQ